MATTELSTTGTNPLLVDTFPADAAGNLVDMLKFLSVVVLADDVCHDSSCANALMRILEMATEAAEALQEHHARDFSRGAQA